MASSLKYIFLGSPAIGATILSRLVAEKGAPLLVVTQEPKQAGRGKQLTPTAVEDEARRLNLPLLATSNLNDPAVVDRIRNLSPDLFLVAAFGQIFKEPVLSVPKICCLNVHTSLLPKYRGAAPVQWAIWNGDRRTGVSIQRMVKKLDAGDVLVQEEIPIAEDDTSDSLLAKLATLGAAASVEAFNRIESGKAVFTPQDETRVSFAPKIEKSHAAIDWNREAGAIRNQIRSMQPWPVAEALLGGQTMKIFRATAEKGKGLTPGKATTDGKTHLIVQCGADTALRIEELKPPSRKRMAISQFLAGFRGTL